MYKEIRDIHIGLRDIKAHWDDPQPVLIVSSSNDRNGNQEYLGPEVRSIKTPGRNII